MTKEEFDLVVIGAGTGGVSVAGPCAKAGSWYSSMRVLLSDIWKK